MTDAKPPVLVVEDDWRISSVHTVNLNDLGFGEVVEAHSVDAALAYLARSACLFACLDVNVGPDLVFPVAAALSASDTPFLFITSKVRSDLPAEWRAHIILPKPTTIDALRAGVDQCLKRGDA